MNSFRFPAEMSLREKIAQLIFVRIGSNMPPVRRVEDDEERVAQLLDDCPVGGLLLFNGGPNTRQSLERLQERSRVPLLVASDIERGVGQQVKGYTIFPHAMALGRPGGNLVLFIQTLVRESRDVGIHIVNGPVADINTNSRNPIISIRAFGEDTERVTQLSAQYVQMVEESGLLSTAKHYPGHGDTLKDSHDSLPSLDLSLDELRSRELIPFQAAIDAGCSLIMTAHIAFPEIDSTGVPATLSSFFLRDLLREEMGFQGVICSDSLLMQGVREGFTNEGDLALATLNAGVDVLLDLEDPAKALDYLVKSVGTGALDEERIDEAFERVGALKRKIFGQPVPPLPELTNGSSTNSIDDVIKQAAEGAARDAIEILHGDALALPLAVEKPLVAILLKPFETSIEPPEQPLGAALRERFRDVHYVQLGPKANPAAYGAARELVRGAKQLVVAMAVRPAAWHAYGLRSQQVEFVRQVTRDRGDVVLVSLGAPYPLADYPEAAVRICTYSDVPVSQEALAEFLISGSKPEAQARDKRQ